MDTINVSEVDISRYQNTSYALNSLNSSSHTLIQSTKNNSLNKDKEEKILTDNQYYKDQLHKLVRPTSTTKTLLYLTITFSVISYVLFIISLSQSKWQPEYSYFNLKDAILYNGVDIIYMIIIILFTIVDFISLIVLLQLNHFYKKTYYTIFLCFSLLGIYFL